MRHIFVINPPAGKGRHLEATRSLILTAAEKLGVPVECYVTQSKGDGARFARETAASAADGEPVRLYACGGDGTLNELVNGVYGFDRVELGCVPVGSGNDFVKSFSEPEAFRDIARQLSGRAEAINVVRCNDLFAINLANIGFDSDVCRRMESYKNLPLVSGKGAYNLALVVTMFQKLGKKLRVRFPGEEPTEDIRVLSAIGNGICYGGGYYATPKASLTDDLLDVALVNRLNLFQILPRVGAYKAGRHLEDPRFEKHLTFRRVPSLRIESDEPMELCIDGEICPVGNAVDFSVAEKRLDFVLPEGVTMVNGKCQN